VTHTIWTDEEDFEFDPDGPWDDDDHDEARSYMRSSIKTPERIREWHDNHSLTVNIEVEFDYYGLIEGRHVYHMKSGYSFDDRTQAIIFQLEFGDS